MLELTSFDAARAALRNRDLRQALYDEGASLMGSVIVNLHGVEHTARRRLENRLFSPETVAWYDRDRIPAIIESVVGRAAAAGFGDAQELARRALMWLSLDVAGIDLPDDPAGRDAAFEDVFSLMHRLATSSVVVHATGDKASIIADGDRALDEFERRFFRPARDRRAALIDPNAGDASLDDLPRDVLTTLLVNDDRLALSPHDVLREVAYFPWVGAHSTAAQLLHLLDHVFERLRIDAGLRGRLIDDPALRLRWVHESLRLHPASPVAVRRVATDTTVDRRSLAIGDEVVIAVAAANRDPAVFVDPDDFVPDRVVPGGVARWGLSFGSGMHACLGRELAAGRETGPDGAHIDGALSLLLSALLRAGATLDPDDPPTLDETTTRRNWGRFPLRFPTAKRTS
ncbi:MAG: cytochrome P450 [Actinomycetota bacterium]